MTTDIGTPSRRRPAGLCRKVVNRCLWRLLVLAVLASASEATFRGKNGRIVYAAQAGRFEQLFTVRPDGTARRQIRGSPIAQAEASVTGRPTALASCSRAVGTRTGRTSASKYRREANGSNLRPINLPRVKPIEPTWFPDGRRILFLYSSPRNRLSRS